MSVVAFSPNQEYLAVAALDNAIHIMKREEDSLIKYEKGFELTGHTSHVIHLDWTQDGKNLRSNSTDHELLFWNIEDECQVSSL